MSEGVSPLPKPQVIMRGDEYALINVDLDGLSDLQRLGVAILIWDQVRLLMESQGFYRERDPHIIGANGIGSTDDIDQVVASLLGISRSSVRAPRPRLLARPDMVEKLVNGEYTSLKKVRKDLGMKIEHSFFEGGKRNKEVSSTSHFGHGDKFHEAMAPLLSYFRIWRKKEFLYTHVNPKEAQKRVKAIDKVMADLAEAREDLVKRSHVATYRAPSEKRRENK